MEELIKTVNLGHSYRGPEGDMVTALENINLTIHNGEFVAIIGTNGSGKSTLAKHFNALLLPTSGKCLVNGYQTDEVSNLWAIRQTVGMVFQNPDNQLVAAVVEEDVAFGPENLGIEPCEIVRRVDEALKLVGMSEYRLHSPHRLSGGQKQRVAIAGMLAMNPKCLVLDEPTAMLDPVGRHEVVETVKSLNKKGMTIIYITHAMEEAVNADRVVVVDRGKLAFQGTPVEVFSQVKRLKNIGLDVPTAADVAWRLKLKGLVLPETIITNKELAVALCP
ncbi:MAG: ecfA1 [Firmicutes bacterium]|nr:ecfA1 [Bacillota bacterium]